MHSRNDFKEQTRAYIERSRIYLDICRRHTNRRLRQNNTDKTEYIFVGHKRPTSRINGQLVNGVPIKRVKKLNALELQWTKTFHGMSNVRISKVKLKCPFVPVEIKENTTAIKIGSGVQGIALESSEIKIGIKFFGRFLLVAYGRKPSKPHFHGIIIRRRISEEDR